MFFSESHDSARCLSCKTTDQKTLSSVNIYILKNSSVVIYREQGFCVFLIGLLNKFVGREIFERIIMAWTEDRVEMLTKLWAEGLSASQIALRLGDVTRNAVIGKVHRLGLPGRATKTRSRTVRKPRKITPRNLGFNKSSGMGRPAAALRNTADSAVRVSGNIQSLHNLFHLEDELDIPVEKRASIETLTDNTCRWPIGDPLEEGFHYCGCSTKEDSTYCEFHHGKAYFTNTQRKRKKVATVIKLAAG